MPFEEPDEPSRWEKLEYVLAGVLVLASLIAGVWSTLTGLL
jgi:hypothetical protein